jgi:hypothetical protein
MIPAGKYIARAEEAEFSQSRTGTDQCRVTLRIEGSDQEGALIDAYLYFSEAAADRSIDSLQLMGCTFPGGDITDTVGLGRRPVEIVVEHENYNGKVRAKVKWINEFGGRGPGPTPISGKEKSAFADRMRALVARKKGTAPAVPAVQAGQGRDNFPWK